MHPVQGCGSGGFWKGISAASGLSYRLAILQERQAEALQPAGGLCSYQPDGIAGPAQPSEEELKLKIEGRERCGKPKVCCPLTVFCVAVLPEEQAAAFQPAGGLHSHQPDGIEWR